MAGWEPAEVTHYVYDEAGRLVRSVTVREPEFTPDDVALLEAVRRNDAEIGRHGIPMPEATDKRNQFAFEPYVVTDYAQQAIERHRKFLEKQNPDADFAGAIIGARKRQVSRSSVPKR